MTKRAYWVASVKISDSEAYREYMDGAFRAFRKFGGRYLTRGGRSQVLEGNCRTRTIIVELKDYKAALSCYNSAEYAEAIRLRKGASVNDILLVEGYDGEQPS
jgi:uncharacterized protein (DUF1330 family)